MSKTRGNVLDPFAVIAEVGAEPLRFYLMREVTLGQDGDVSVDGLYARYNNELANELGNLAEPHGEHDRQVPRRGHPSVWT